MELGDKIVFLQFYEPIKYHFLVKFPEKKTNIKAVLICSPIHNNKNLVQFFNIHLIYHPLPLTIKNDS